MNTDSRGALGAIFGAIQSLMVALIGLFKTADKAVAMLDVAVTDSQQRQAVRSAVDMTDYATRYVQDAARRMHESEVATREYLARSPEHAEGYQRCYDRLLKAVNERTAMHVEQAVQAKEPRSKPKVA